MAPIYFPLRWESTGDQWWYASPIDWAAANGHYDLVRELLRLDNNHLIKLTSLRRIRRLESVWDDDSHFHDVAKFRAQVARKLLVECESTTRKGKNSLIGAGYGGWLMYTAASAGDLGFVQELLERDPLLVFGEGEFGVTDILYAAARSKNCEVFRVLYDFAVSPRFCTKGGEVEEHIGEFPPLYRSEMMNRAVHAASRGGNLVVLKELLGDCSDVLAYRDVHGSTILHAAAGKGQVEVVKYLTETYNIADTTDRQGNTALNLAAFKGQPATVQALLAASPSSVSIRNNAGETFLHMAVSGFQTPGFRRLDRQMELIKQLIDSDALNVQDIINVKNKDGRTALHVAIVGNLHSELVELLMTVRTIDVNVKDGDGMTPLDLLRLKPKSASSDILIRHLISVGGMFGSTRKAIASQLKMQGCGTSPGTSFRIADSEILSYTGIESAVVDGIDLIGTTSTSFDSTNENHNNNNSSVPKQKPGSVNYAAQQIKKVLHWPRPKSDKNTPKKVEESPPVPLRERFSKVPSHKRTLSVRSNISSPSNRKKLAMGLSQGVMESMPHLNLACRKTPSSSFSLTSISSPGSVDKQKGVFSDEATHQKQGSIGKRLRSQYFCFGGSSLAVKKTVVRCSVASVA